MEDLEERKYNSYLQEQQEGGSRELRASPLHLLPWGSEGANNLGKHFQTCKE